MSAALIERLLKNREFKVEAGGHVFVIRRPTDLEWAEKRARDELNARGLMQCIVGWDKVTELDMYSGGDGQPAAFNSSLAELWLGDRPDLLVPIITRINEVYREHLEARDAARKN